MLTRSSNTIYFDVCHLRLSAECGGVQYAVVSYILECGCGTQVTGWQDVRVSGATMLVRRWNEAPSHACCPFSPGGFLCLTPQRAKSCHHVARNCVDRVPWLVVGCGRQVNRTAPTHCRKSIQIHGIVPSKKDEPGPICKRSGSLPPDHSDLGTKISFIMEDIANLVWSFGSCALTDLQREVVIIGVIAWLRESACLLFFCSHHVLFTCEPFSTLFGSLSLVLSLLSLGLSLCSSESTCTLMLLSRFFQR